jgi:hypothetical protein
VDAMRRPRIPIIGSRIGVAIAVASNAAPLRNVCVAAAAESPIARISEPKSASFFWWVPGRVVVKQAVSSTVVRR